jgi:hypothetical protein
MGTADYLRGLIARTLDWEDAHVGFERAVADFPGELRGVVPSGFAHSCWEMLEHLRIAQADILEFCVNPDYAEKAWPDEYWPASVAPADDDAWQASITGFLLDVDALREVALDTSIDLFDEIPHGDGQTYLRELLLVLDHNAYHLGQFVAARRALGAWE